MGKGSKWGVLALAVLLLGMGTVLFRRIQSQRRADTVAKQQALEAANKLQPETTKSPGTSSLLAKLDEAGSTGTSPAPQKSKPKKSTTSSTSWNEPAADKAVDLYESATTPATESASRVTLRSTTPTESSSESPGSRYASDSSTAIDPLTAAREQALVSESPASRYSSGTDRYASSANSDTSSSSASRYADDPVQSSLPATGSAVATAETPAYSDPYPAVGSDAAGAAIPTANSYAGGSAPTADGYAQSSVAQSSTPSAGGAYPSSNDAAYPSPSTSADTFYGASPREPASSINTTPVSNPSYAGGYAQSSTPADATGGANSFADSTGRFREPRRMDTKYDSNVTPAVDQSPAVDSGVYRQASAPKATLEEMPTGDAGASGKYSVEPNDSYWIIAKKVYRDGAYFKAVYEHNRDRFPDPAKLQVGDELKVPDVAKLREYYPNLCPKLRTLPEGTPQTSTVSARNYGGGRRYVVESGDTLFDIARYELGKAELWATIYRMNRDVLTDDLNYLRPGTVLLLPDSGPAETDQRPDSLTRRPGDGIQR